MPDVKTPGKMSTMPTPVSNFRIPADVKERAVVRAQSEGKTLSEVVIDLLREYGGVRQIVRTFPVDGIPATGYTITRDGDGYSWSYQNAHSRVDTFLSYSDERGALIDAADHAWSISLRAIRDSMFSVADSLRDVEGD